MHMYMGESIYIYIYTHYRKQNYNTLNVCFNLLKIKYPANITGLQ